jgi:hypothetical protein
VTGQIKAASGSFDSVSLTGLLGAERAEIGTLDVRSGTLVVLANGNVGIGTTAPEAPLDIRGALRLDDPNAPLIYLHERDQTDPAGRWRIAADGDTLSFRRRTQAGTWTGEGYPLIMERATGNVQIGHDSPGTIYYDHASGRVGIGTTSPSATLEVRGTIRVSQASTIQINGLDPNGGIEIRSGAGGGTPFLDLSNDGSTDYDARLILYDDDTLSLDGASFRVGGDAFGVDAAKKVTRTSEYVKEFSGIISGPGNWPTCNEPAKVVHIGKIVSDNYYGSFIEITVFGSHRGFNQTNYFEHGKWVVMAGDHVSSNLITSVGTPHTVDLWNGLVRGNYDNINIGASGFDIRLHVNPYCGANIHYTYVVRYAASANFTPSSQRSW